MATVPTAPGVPKVTIRLDGTGALLDVDVDGHEPVAELIEERDGEPMPSFGDHRIPRPWLAAG
jgi:hypothetical protein